MDCVLYNSVCKSDKAKKSSMDTHFCMGFLVNVYGYLCTNKSIIDFVYGNVRAAVYFGNDDK